MNDTAARPAATHRVVAAGDRASPLVVEVTRGTMVESLHRGIVAVVDADGGVVHGAGDVDRPVYARSAIKPIQAIAHIETGAAERFAATDDEVALTCASHAGEPMHVERVTAWLARMGLGVDDLECGPQLPYHEATANAMLRRGEAPTRAHNNCSGKHAGMLATARHLGEPTRGYIEAGHPVQRRLIRLHEELGAVDLSGTARGVDGCGIPVFGMPLKAIARAMAQIAAPDRLGPVRAAACRRIVEACAAHPLLLSGTGRFNSAVLAETGEAVLLKGGAEGVYAAAVPGRGLGICLKIDDGAGRASQVAIGWVLRRLGLLDDAQAARLADHLEAPVTNWAGRLVGTVRSAPDLSF